MVTRDYQAKLLSQIWPTAETLLDSLTDDQLDVVYSVRRWMQEGEGYKLLPFVGGTYKIYSLYESNRRLVYITLGQPKDAMGLVEEVPHCLTFIEVAFTAEGQQAAYISHYDGYTIAGAIDLTTIKRYSCKDEGNGEPTGSASARYAAESKARLAELEKPQEPVPATYSNPGKVKLYDLTSPQINSSWFQRSIYDDANRLIIAIEQNPFFLNHILHYIKTDGTWEGNFAMTDGLTDAERKQWYDLTNSCDTHGHSGWSWNAVEASATWRILGLTNIDSTKADPMPDLLKLVNYDQVLPGSLK